MDFATSNKLADLERRVKQLEDLVQLLQQRLPRETLTLKKEAKPS